MGIRSTRNRLALIIISLLFASTAHGAALRTLDDGSFVSYCKQYDFIATTVTNTGQNCVVTPGGAASAPADATYITQIANGTLTNEQAMSALASGLLYNTTATGVLSIATAGTDYVIPSGNVATATALAADPTDCGVNNFANAIDANGNLTCAVPAGFDSTAVDSVTWSDGANASNAWTFDLSGTDPVMTLNSGAIAITGNLTATNLSGSNTGDQTNIAGNAATATALAADPADCGVNTYAQSIAASGALTCGTVTAASADFANQGTTTTVLHGNAAGNPSWSSIAVSDLSTGTDGELITWDASGDPSTVAVGTATHVLTSNGVGVAPTFQVIPTQPETNSLETVMTGVATTEIPIGQSAGDIAVYYALSGDATMTEGGVVTVSNSSTVDTNANLTGIVTSVGNATAIADKAISYTKLSDGTDGELITWDSSGVAAVVAAGTATQVLTSNGAGAAPTFQAVGGGDGLSNAIFNWSGVDTVTASQSGLYEGTDQTADAGAATFNYYYFVNDRLAPFTILTSKFRKIASINTITIYAKLWAADTNGTRESVLTVDIGGQSNTAHSVNSITPTWYAGTGTINVSGLSDGTVYDITISLHNETNSWDAYCSAVALIGS